MSDDRLYEKELSRKIVYKGKIFSVAECKAELPGNIIADREIVLHNGGVGILPIDSENNIYLVKQYRYAADEITLEIPAGKLELNEDPASCAERELSEETGFVAGNIYPMGYLYGSPAILKEKIYIYFAKDLEKREQHLDFDEHLDVVKMPLDEAYRLVLYGEIRDAKTEIAILKAKALISL